jgi:hypothetical protein
MFENNGAILASQPGLPFRSLRMLKTQGEVTEVGHGKKCSVNAYDCLDRDPLGPLSSSALCWFSILPALWDLHGGALVLVITVLTGCQEDQKKAIALLLPVMVAPPETLFPLQILPALGCERNCPRVRKNQIKK